MSHNKIKVAGQEPNSAGDINFAFEDLSDISVSSLSEDQIFQYNGSSFVNTTLSSSLDTSSKFTVFAKEGAFFNSSGDYEVNDYLFLARDTMTGRTKAYTDSSFITSNSATASNTIKSNIKFFESIDILQAGTYLCICSVPLKSDDGGYTIRWHSNAGGFGAKSTIHYTNNSGSLVVGIVTSPANDVLRLVVESIDGTVTAPSYNNNRSFSFHIFKL